MTSRPAITSAGTSSSGVAGGDANDLLADEMRTLIETLMSTQPSTQQLEKLRTSVGEMQSVLGDQERNRYWERGETGAGFAKYSPYRGVANPVAPPMVIEPDTDRPDERVRATVTVSPVYEGPPGSVHGGMIAAMFDEIMGAAQLVGARRQAGVTAKLEVRYRALTPTNQPLVLSAWIDSETSRRCIVRAECHSGTDRTAEAQALFVRRPGASQ